MASSWKSFLGNYLPAKLGMPLRSKFGDSPEREIKILKFLVNKEETSIDIGAHRGTYSYPISQLIGNTGNLIAIEPQPELVHYLKSGIRRKNCLIIQAAISSQMGEVEIKTEIANGRLATGGASIDSKFSDFHSFVAKKITLDSLSLDKVSFIKIDAEGHELEILYGGPSTISNCLPKLLIEIEYRFAGDKQIKLYDRLTELGYGAYFYNGFYLDVVRRSDFIDSKLNYPEDDFSKFRNNFLFLQPPDHKKLLNEIRN